ncbi:MAG: hypothetical protein IT361_00995 [Gemmatimonadaceae bacterium]|nr:hypothetical protein [Gemmatimonadaceae bacterium]
MPDLREREVGVRHTTEELMLPALQLAFARLHKAAFGVATGVAGALLMGSITAMCLLVPRAQTFPLGLLSEYFAGYAVSWRGLVIGMAWGFLVAFVAGWFVAFCRNLALAVSAFMIRTRAEIEQTRNFLDHI